MTHIPSQDSKQTNLKKKKMIIWSQLGRDEKGCKMDVDGRRRALTVDGLEKCGLVEVDQEKCSGVDVDCRQSTLTKPKVPKKFKIFENK